MEKESSKYLIFADQSWPVESVAKALPSRAKVSIWIHGKGWVTPHGKAKKNQKTPNINAERAAKSWSPTGTINNSVAIVGFQDTQLTHRVVDILKSKQQSMKILEFGAKESQSFLRKKKRVISWKKFLSNSIDTEMALLDVQERVNLLRTLFLGTNKLALLLQEDPDPDGLASALALRKVLNRNAQSAPIVSFGRISRPENLAMSRLLDIEVLQITRDQLEQYDAVMLVDCQPSFFKGQKFEISGVIDHHPRCMSAEIEAGLKFLEMREDLGSISTLMTQYLRAANVEPSQRLATALLYGIKSDTLLLNREVSNADLEAFVYLYPRINTSTLRKIERPELPLQYLNVLRLGLANLVVKDNIAVLPLGNIEKEEWVSQAADFALQIEGAEWALGCGIFQSKLVISCRNCGYVQHAGEHFKRLFDKMGCAGGHRSMAKALVDVTQWEKKWGKDSLNSANLVNILQQILGESLKANHDAPVSTKIVQSV